MARFLCAILFVTSVCASLIWTRDARAAAADMLGWTLYDPYNRWSYSNPDNFTGRMDETNTSSTVGPGWVLSDFVLPPTAGFTLTAQVAAGTADDDPFGFVFNWQDSDHFYQVDWKKGSQSFNWGDTVAVNDDLAERGLKLKLIDGGFTRDGLWGGQDGLGVSTLAGPNDQPWAAGTTYTFDVTLTPGHIVVELDGAPLFDVNDNTLAGGRIGLFGFSQDNLIFTVPNVTAIEGDLDGDGFIGISDLNLVLGNWNQTVPPGDPLADPSGDNFVGIEDLNTVLGNWNAGTPPQIAVPEPVTAITAFVACLILTGKRLSSHQLR